MISYTMSHEDYHADKSALSSSVLKKMLRDQNTISLAHAKDYMDSPPEQSQAMAMGSALHCAILEPMELLKRFVVMPEMDRRTKSGKEEYAAFMLKNSGKEFLTEEQRDLVNSMAAAIKGHEDAAKLLCNPEPSEVSLFWEDGELKCKARLDKYLKAEETIVDIKSTRDASPYAFERDILKMGYWIQAGWYTLAAQANQLPAKKFVFVAVENVRPFGVLVHELDPYYIEAAYQKLIPMVEAYREAVKTNHWPAYSTIRNRVMLPSWMDNQEDE